MPNFCEAFYWCKSSARGTKDSQFIKLTPFCSGSKQISNKIVPKNKTSYLSEQYHKLNFVCWKNFDFVLRPSGKFCPYLSPNNPVPGLQ